ncbi:hypothetical protein [Saccharothrix syringae]|uniref:Uncharacterized protein n=1 Tax=Saccharothrix syringae TaxID=103733 RepID=A0A5Q0GXL2_SACSY|nr:hypothetical protein [Saccharothrix syringae]QFZ18708.1 hypothetical protein EKG83_15680 [Saccharothrix syringae]
MAESVVGVLRVTSSRYAAHHPAWLRQVDDLVEQLRGVAAAGDDDEGVVLRVEPDLSEPPPDPAGSKGLVEVSALVLASAQVIRSAAWVIREWAKVDAGRKVSLRIERDGREIVLEGIGERGVEASLELLRSELESGAEVERRDDVR